MVRFGFTSSICYWVELFAIPGMIDVRTATSSFWRNYPTSPSCSEILKAAEHVIPVTCIWGVIGVANEQHNLKGSSYLVTLHSSQYKAGGRLDSKVSSVSWWSPISTLDTGTHFHKPGSLYVIPLFNIHIGLMNTTVSNWNYSFRPKFPFVKVRQFNPSICA